MDLYEYQAKHLFGKHNVPVTAGEVCTTADAAREAARKIGSQVVIKAQVKTGGRGKAGGVKLADKPDEAQEIAKAILGMDIKGHTVYKVLVNEASDIADEYYVSFLLDRANRTFLAMASVAGGMEIEEVAATRPEELAMIRVDALEGCTPEKAEEIVEAARFPEPVRAQVVDILQKLWRVLIEEDATLVEVNPLALTPTGEVLALDGKVTLDDNAHYRHASHADFVDRDNTDPIELRAKEFDLNYVKLHGEVGIVGNGAGPGHEHSGRRGVRGRGVRRHQARELPRHRRRRECRGHGERPGHRPQRPRGRGRLRQRLRRHHRRATRSPTASSRRSRCWPPRASR